MPFRQYRLQGLPGGGTALKGKRPTVLVVHVWWGHSEYARKRPLLLAAMGYTALAVDRYGDGKTANYPDDTGTFTGEGMKNKALARNVPSRPVPLFPFAATPAVDSGGSTETEQPRFSGYPLQGRQTLFGRVADEVDRRHAGDNRVGVIKQRKKPIFARYTGGHDRLVQGAGHAGVLICPLGIHCFEGRVMCRSGNGKALQQFV